MAGWAGIKIQLVPRKFHPTCVCVIVLIEHYSSFRDDEPQITPDCSVCMHVLTAVL